MGQLEGYIRLVDLCFHVDIDISDSIGFQVDRETCWLCVHHVVVVDLNAFDLVPIHVYYEFDLFE
jgi:hypothetical protein